MKFLKTYWYLIIVFILTLGVGVMALLTSQKLQQTGPVAPNVPQSTPQAAAPACTLTFSLGESPTPTVTGSVTPTLTTTITPTVTGSITPTVTGSVTPTPTSPSNNTLPECASLTVNPNTSNEAPLSVTLTCNGRDVDGDVTAAEFTFGDGQTQLVERNVGSPGSLTTTHTYTNIGRFQPSCRIRDNNFTFSSTPDSCKKTITIGDTTPTPTGTITNSSAAPTPKIPVAGAGPTILGVSAIGGGILLLLIGLLAF